MKKTILIRNSVIYFTILLFICLLFLVNYGNNNQAQSIFQIDSKDVTTMKISYNEKEGIELSRNEINSFINLVKECPTPLNLRKMKVIESYLVEIGVGKTKTKVKFVKKNGMPFMMIPISNGSINSYECRSMESFLKKYK